MAIFHLKWCKGAWNFIRIPYQLGGEAMSPSDIVSFPDMWSGNETNRYSGEGTEIIHSFILKNKINSNCHFVNGGRGDQSSLHCH